MLSTRDLTRGFARETLYRLTLPGEMRHIEARNPVLVYQMGKVGSSSVVAHLSQLGIHHPVCQVHTLDRDHLQFAKRRARSTSGFLTKHLLQSQRLVPLLENGPFPCRIITLTREPISRAISFVFEDMRKQAPTARRSDGSLDKQKLTEATLDLLQGDNGIADPTRWFDSELKKWFGIDVFSEPYDLERGYNRFRNHGVELLLLRLEDLSRGLAFGLSDLFGGVDVPPHVSRANVGAKKWYSKELAELKHTLRLEGPIMERVVGTRYFHHFYGTEVASIKKRWAKRNDIGVQGPRDVARESANQTEEVQSHPATTHRELVSDSRTVQQLSGYRVRGWRGTTAPPMSPNDIIALHSGAPLSREQSLYLGYQSARLAFLLHLVSEVSLRYENPRILDVAPHFFTSALRSAFAGDAAISSLGWFDDQLVDRSQLDHHYEYDLNLSAHTKDWIPGIPQDIVVIGEVLEHLIVDPRAVLSFISTFVAPGGTLILQTPNAVSVRKRLQMLWGRNPYEMPKTVPGQAHVREYTSDELLSLIKDAGFRDQKIHFCDYWPERGLLRPLEILAPPLRRGITLVATRPH